MQSFREALKHVAKSGEVWCEGARIYLNPLSKDFHLLVMLHVGVSQTQCL